jgi:hypothetical protein
MVHGRSQGQKGCKVFRKVEHSKSMTIVREYENLLPHGGLWSMVHGRYQVAGREKLPFFSR